VKILVFNWQDIKNPYAGGAEVHLHETFSRIAAKGHSVTLVSSSFRGAAPRDFIDGIKVYRTGSRNTYNFAVPLWYLFFGGGYDIVVDDVNKIPFFTPLYIRKPLVTIFHHLFGKSIWLETNPVAAAYVTATEWLIPKVYKSVPVIAVSESTKSELVSKGIPDENIRVVHNSVDHNLYKPGKPVPRKEPVIGFLGRIKKYKSIEHLLEAFCRVKTILPDAILTIVGDGDYLPALKKYAVNLGIADDTTFTGYVSGEEKVRLVNNMDLIVNTSSKEGWGLTVIEANACGIPVIGANVSGLRDSILHDETGILYTYGNIEELATAIVTLIRNREKRDRLARNAITWAGRFNWDRSAESVLHILEQTQQK
jgi:glycosyltransferase involved in cell wall biosynthesis